MISVSSLALIMTYFNTAKLAQFALLCIAIYQRKVNFQSISWPLNRNITNAIDTVKPVRDALDVISGKWNLMQIH